MRTSVDTYYRFGALLALVAMLSLSACARPAVRELTEPGQSGYAVASWYGAKFHGRPTASGERFDMYGYTAAHKTLPFGTKLKITYPVTGRSVVVVINDRGPFIRGRSFDLSYGAAKKIGMVGAGTARVRYEYLGRDERYKKRVSYSPKIKKPATSPSSPKPEIERPATELPDYYTIQVGSYLEPENADRMKTALAIKYTSIYITTVHLDGQKFHRVRLGKFKTREKAEGRAEILAEEGYEVMVAPFD